MIYVISAVAGAVYGFVTGVLKFILLWRRVMRPKEGDKPVTRGALFMRIGASFVINLTILAVVFLLRNILPLHFVTTIIAAATGLVISGRAFVGKKFSERMFATANENKNDSLGGLQ